MFAKVPTLFGIGLLCTAWISPALGEADADADAAPQEYFRPGQDGTGLQPSWPSDNNMVLNRPGQNGGGIAPWYKPGYESAPLNRPGQNGGGIPPWYLQPSYGGNDCFGSGCSDQMPRSAPVYMPVNPNPVYSPPTGDFGYNPGYITDGEPTNLDGDDGFNPGVVTDGGDGYNPGIITDDNEGYNPGLITDGGEGYNPGYNTGVMPCSGPMCGTPNPCASSCSPMPQAPSCGNNMNCMSNRPSICSTGSGCLSGNWLRPARPNYQPTWQPRLNGCMRRCARTNTCGPRVLSACGMTPVQTLPAPVMPSVQSTGFGSYMPVSNQIARRNAPIYSQPWGGMMPVNQEPVTAPMPMPVQPVQEEQSSGCSGCG